MHWYYKYYNVGNTQSCEVVKVQEIWGEPVYREWLPIEEMVVRMTASYLQPLDAACGGSSDEITYIAASARASEVLTRNRLLFPIESAVTRLPHQISVLGRFAQAGALCSGGRGWPTPSRPGSSCARSNSGGSHAVTRP